MFNTVEPYIETRYGVPVVIRDVTDPFTGDLDRERIEVDYDQSCEDALFIIVHLFEHTQRCDFDDVAEVLAGRGVIYGTRSLQLRDDPLEPRIVAERFVVGIVLDPGTASPSQRAQAIEIIEGFVLQSHPRVQTRGRHQRRQVIRMELQRSS
jgi:hypothetical protein